MKLKSRLLPFSLIRIWCQRTFCLRLRSRLHLSKFWYTRTVRLGTLGCFRLAENTISRWPDWYGDRLFFQIRVRKDSVQINNCASEFYSQTQGAIDYNAHRSVIGGGGWYCHTDQNNGSMHVYFVTQIRFRPPLTGLVVGGMSAEPQLRSHGVCRLI